MGAPGFKGRNLVNEELPKIHTERKIRFNTDRITTIHQQRRFMFFKMLVQFVKKKKKNEILASSTPFLAGCGQEETGFYPN